MDVSIIMINYNTYDFTCDALESIFKHTSGVEYEVILIDNKSPDGSGDKLAEKYGDKIVYIQAGGNLGTSKSFNLGIQKSSGKYVLWLNTDILIKENFIYKLFDFMENNLQCGICGGNILDFNGNPTHSYRKEISSPQTARKDMSIAVKIFRKLFKKALSEEYNYSDRVKEVGYITGADMMIRREILDKIGGFDEDIFMYSEEVEFTYRTKALTGYTVCNVPWAHIWHLEGASFNGANKQFNLNRFTLSLQGNCVYIKKYFGEKGLRKFLNCKTRAYNKLITLFAICFKFKKCKEYKAKKAAVKRIREEKLQGVNFG